MTNGSVTLPLYTGHLSEKVTVNLTLSCLYTIRRGSSPQPWFKFKVLFSRRGSKYELCKSISFIMKTKCRCSYNFLCPWIEWSGAYCFCPVCLFVCLSVCLFVCLSVVNFNLRYNFWTVRDRDFIFCMHTPVMMPFQMTSRSMTLWPWL